jgi:hypothetical protein
MTVQPARDLGRLRDGEQARGLANGIEPARNRIARRRAKVLDCVHAGTL